MNGVARTDRDWLVQVRRRARRCLVLRRLFHSSPLLFAMPAIFFLLDVNLLVNLASSFTLPLSLGSGGLAGSLAETRQRETWALRRRL